VEAAGPELRSRTTAPHKFVTSTHRWRSTRCRARDWQRIFMTTTGRTATWTAGGRGYATAGPCADSGGTHRGGCSNSRCCRTRGWMTTMSTPGPLPYESYPSFPAATADEVVIEVTKVRTNTPRRVAPAGVSCYETNGIHTTPGCRVEGENLGLLLGSFLLVLPGAATASGPPLPRGQSSGHEFRRRRRADLERRRKKDLVSNDLSFDVS